MSTFNSTFNCTFLCKSTFKSAKNSTLKSTIWRSEPYSITPIAMHCVPKCVHESVIWETWQDVLAFFESSLKLNLHWVKSNFQFSLTLNTLLCSNIGPGREQFIIFSLRYIFKKCYVLFLFCVLSAVVQVLWIGPVTY